MTGPWGATRWPTVGLAKIAEVQLGKMLQPRAANDADQLTPYLRAGSLAHLDGLGELPEMYASLEDRSTYQVEQGDLVVAEGGDVGRPEFIPDVPSPTIIQNSLHRVRPAAHVADTRFVRYALEAVHSGEWLEVLCNRSTFGHLTLEKLRSLTVPLAPVVEQRAIADFLDTETARIDALIAKKGKLARALRYRTSTRHDMLCLPIPVNHRHTPDDVPRAEEVPVGWRVAPLSLLLERITYGFTNPMPTTDEGPWMLTANDVGEGEILWGGARRTAWPEYESLTAKSRPKQGDVLVTKDGSLGRVALLAKKTEVCVNQSIAVLTPRRDVIRPELLAHLLRSESYNSALVYNAGGTTIKHLYITRMSKQRVAFPPSLDDQDDLIDALRAVEARGARLDSELARSVALLREHRQALITAAVTGQMSVPGAAA